MKKKLSFILAVIFGLAFVMLPIFSTTKNSKSNIASALSNAEEEFFIEGNSFDLISKNPNGDIGNCSIEDVAPFDTNTKTMMEGKSVTPTADEYGQILNPIGLRINGFVPTKNDVIYLWVYLIDAVTFKLKFSLNSGSASGLEWEFDSSQVYEMGTGWKILALSFSKFTDEQIGTNEYNSLSVSYYSEYEDFKGEEGYEKYEVVANENFSIFHVFVTKNANLSQNSGIVYSLGKSFYKFKDDFDLSNTVFIGDKIKLNSANEIFDYLYVGKYDLTTYTTSGRYFWKLSIKSPSASSFSQVEFGKDINFYETGYYCINIALYEKLTLYNKQILNEDISIYCDELSLGYFLMGTKYKIKDNENILLSFKLTQGITILEELSVSLTNNNAIVDSYYEEDGIVYVLISGVSGGSCELEITAKAISEKGSRYKTFSSTASIEIESTEKETDIFIVILWITFGCFCLVFVVYLVISLVKSRKNDVK